MFDTLSKLQKIIVGFATVTLLGSYLLITSSLNFNNVTDFIAELSLGISYAAFLAVLLTLMLTHNSVKLTENSLNETRNSNRQTEGTLTLTKNSLQKQTDLIEKTLNLTKEALELTRKSHGHNEATLQLLKEKLTVNQNEKQNKP